MLVTTKEAKFLFCPLLTTPDGKMRFCQAAQCMMWRWQGENTGEDAPGFCGLAATPAGRSRLAGAAFLSAGPKKEPASPFD